MERQSVTRIRAGKRVSGEAVSHTYTCRKKGNWSGSQSHVYVPGKGSVEGQSATRCRKKGQSSDSQSRGAGKRVSRATVCHEVPEKGSVERQSVTRCRKKGQWKDSQSRGAGKRVSRATVSHEVLEKGSVTRCRKKCQSGDSQSHHCTSVPELIN